MHAVPRFLWNAAKMRFGKTFATYQLAKRLGAKRVLVITFKPAVEDAWQTDLESHVDFDGWQYLSRSSNGDPSKISRRRPVVYFGSFQDLLGRDAAGNIKPKNEWVHTVNWDLVVFDEYHFLRSASAGQRRLPTSSGVTTSGDSGRRPALVTSSPSRPLSLRS